MPSSPRDPSCGAVSGSRPSTALPRPSPRSPTLHTYQPPAKRSLSSSAGPTPMCAPWSRKPARPSGGKRRHVEGAVGQSDAGPAELGVANECSWSALRKRRIEECQHHIQYQRRTSQAEEVRRSGEHRELRGRDPDEVAVHVTPAQPEEPHHVVEVDGVAVPHRYQGRRGDSLNVGV